MRRKGSKAQAVLARVLRAVVIAAVMAVMVPVGVPGAQAAGAEYWVDIANGVDDASHGTEAAPFKTITYAASVADGTDTIWVEPGTYSTANGETLQIILNGETLVSTAGAQTTILQGNGSQMLLVINGWDDGDRLEGFWFDNGGTGTGAAVLVNLGYTIAVGSEPVIANNKFTGCDNGTGGALIVSSPDDSVVTGISVESNAFSYNTATDGGAFEYDGYGPLDLIDNTFLGNSAEYGGAVAIRSWDAAVAVVGNDFTDNAASNSGGAIYWDGHGSQLWHDIACNWFADNTAATAGGAAYLNHTQAVVDSNYADGSSAVSGGFAYLEQGNVTAENNYITGSSATHAAVVWQLDSSSLLRERNDTLYAQAGGPAVTRLESGGLYSTLEITGCIYWNPLVTNEIVNAESLSYTCSYDDATTLGANGNVVGAGMVYADPQVDTGMGLGMIMPTSPCVDAGNPADFPAYDLFETPRPLDGDGDRVAVPDIGCYESPDVSPPVTLNPVWRFYNAALGTHFYTASSTEKANALANLSHIYTLEGEAYRMNPAANATPLHRFYRPATMTHFYTASATEKANVIANLSHVYTYEGPAYNVSLTQPAFGIQVWRFFNTRNGTHFYTASAAEKATVIATLSHIYNYEGPAFYIGQ